MKILHSADWHWGHQLYGYDRTEEQLDFLAQLTQLVKENQPDAFLLSGDVFHVPLPSIAAQKMYNNAMFELHKAAPDMQIVVIAGNHDSASRLELSRELWDYHSVHVIGELYEQRTIDYHKFIVPVQDKGYVVAVPHVYPRNFPPAADGSDAQAAFFRQLHEQVQALNTQHKPIVLMAHLAVQNVDLTGHKRFQDDTIGTIEYVHPDIFGQYDYIALGHIHRCQTVPHSNCTYAGSPLAVSFDEDYQHSVTLVTMESGKPLEIQHLPIENPWPLLTIPERPLPFDEAIACLQRFDDQQKAYIRLNVTTQIALPADYNEQAANAARQKQCRFCTLQVHYETVLNNPQLLQSITPLQLQDMSPAEVADKYMKALSVPQEKVQDFLEMIDEIQHEINQQQAQ